MDLSTGRLIHVDEKKPQVGKETVNICPMAPGSKDWQPSSFSPRTGLVYIPHENMCMDEQYNEANYIAGTPYIGATVRYYAGPGGNMGELMAWDPIAGKKVWTISDKYPTWSGTVVTAGDLVFSARSTAGSRPLTRAPARSFGSSRQVPASSGSPSAIPVRTASNTSRSFWRQRWRSRSSCSSSC